MTLHIEVDSEADQKFENVSIKTVGLSSSQNIEFLDPESQAIDVTAKGSPANIKKLKKSDIELYVNVSDLDDGEHSVKLEVNGPQNVTWSLGQKSAKIKLTSKKAIHQLMTTAAIHQGTRMTQISKRIIKRTTSKKIQRTLIKTAMIKNKTKIKIKTKIRMRTNPLRIHNPHQNKKGAIIKWASILEQTV